MTYLPYSKQNFHFNLCTLQELSYTLDIAYRFFQYIFFLYQIIYSYSNLVTMVLTWENSTWKFFSSGDIIKKVKLIF